MTEPFVVMDIFRLLQGMGYDLTGETADKLDELAAGGRARARCKPGRPSLLSLVLLILF